MKIRQVNYEDGEPAAATFELSIREMAYLTKLLGDQSANSANAIMRGAADIDCYGPLSVVFNGHWGDGVDGYLAEVER